MNNPTYVITYDVGTTGIKTCLLEIDQTIKLIASSMSGYELYVFDNGGAEQSPDEWWNAMCVTTKDVFEKTDVKPEQIAGISFCSQMQGLVLVDKDGNAVRNAMSYMDQRAKKELKEGIAHGLQVAGVNVFKLIKSLNATGAVAASVKDPVWKYKWVENNEKEVFKKVYKWLDVKEYLICRCTDKFVMTQDSAFATLLYDTRKGKTGWSKSICKMLGVNMDHLAPIIKSTDEAGKITAKAAEQLGLCEGTPVFGGGGDASLIGVGAGSVSVGDTHIYSGTSGWVSTVVDKQTVDINAMIAAVVGVDDGKYNYFAELETSGKCLEWVKNHLALDEIGIYLKKEDVAQSQESIYISLYDYMMDAVSTVKPGCDGVIFTPWLHGNRCPFEDPNAAGMFFNISIDTGKTELIRSVLEGICFHKRWMLEAQMKKVKTSDTIRFVGGGALSSLTCQILSDVLQRKIETVDSPQNVGAVGAAAVVGVGLEIIKNIDEVKNFIPASATFTPNPENKEIYDRNFEVFKKLYKANKKNFAILNSIK